VNAVAEVAVPVAVVDAVALVDAAGAELNCCCPLDALSCGEHIETLVSYRLHHTGCT